MFSWWGILKRRRARGRETGHAHKQSAIARREALLGKGKAFASRACRRRGAASGAPADENGKISEPEPIKRRRPLSSSLIELCHLLLLLLCCYKSSRNDERTKSRPKNELCSRAHDGQARKSFSAPAVRKFSPRPQEKLCVCVCVCAVDRYFIRSARSLIIERCLADDNHQARARQQGRRNTRREGPMKRYCGELITRGWSKTLCSGSHLFLLVVVV